MKPTKEQIAEAAKRGIVPGALISCASISDDKALVPPTSEWEVFSDHYFGFRSEGNGLDRIYIGSPNDKRWATVIKPAPPTISDRIKEVLSKHPEAKAALKELHPEAFEDEPFEFGHRFSVDIPSVRNPLYIGNAYAPCGLSAKCLIVGEDYEMRQQEHNGRTVLTFHKKKQ